MQLLIAVPLQTSFVKLIPKVAQLMWTKQNDDVYCLKYDMLSIYSELALAPNEVKIAEFIFMPENGVIYEIN